MLVDFERRPYSAGTFVDWLKNLRLTWPRRGKDIRLDYIESGIIISLSSDVFWRHPWSMTFAYTYDQDKEKRDSTGGWEAFVCPGFVNGEDTYIEQRSKDGAASMVPLTAEDRPRLKLSAWRNPLQPSGVSVSTDGELVVGAGEGYPKYFESIGVRPAAKGGKLEDPTYEIDPYRTREIRACDVFLETPRAALTSQVTVLDPLIDSQSVRISSTIINSYLANAKAPHELKATTKFTPILKPTLEERMYGTAVEAQADQIKIATVWAVSAPDVGYSAEIDASWTLYPQYNVFWNLMHAAKREVKSTPNDPLVLKTGLLAGDFLFAALLAPANAAYEEIAAYFNAGDYSGTYWTI